MDAVAEVKDRLGIDEVIGEYVQLKTAGTNLKGLCPFHHEKTPSFIVSPDKGIYHCFGCGEGGDIFSFVQKADGLAFREALEMLAGRAGVDLPEQTGAGSQQAKEHKQQVYEALSTAAQYYHIQLGRSRRPKQYVQQERGFQNDTIKTFQLGWAPEGGTHLLRFLKGKDFTERVLQDAGLIKQRSGREYDVFRGRVVVPFFDNQGRVIGFTGRVLGDGMPKYLNSSQTNVFDKSRFVFGLYQAKESIRRHDEAVVVEGNFDVVSSHQANISWVVAMSGTAVTVHQLKQLRRLTRNVTFAFDADAAGLAATERAIPMIQEADIKLSIVTLPEGADPDDIIREDPKQWKRLLDDRTYVVDWLLEVLQQEYDLSTASDKKDFTDRISSTLQRLKDPVEQEHYIERVADIINATPAAIKQKLARGEKHSPPPVKTAQNPEKSPQSSARDDISTVSGALASLAATYPDSRVALKDLEFDDIDEETKAVLAYLKRSPEDITNQTPEDLQTVETYVKILLLRGEQEYGSWALLDRQVEAFSLAHRLHELQTKRQKERISQEIAAAEAAGDVDLRQKLLKRYQELN